MPKSSYTRPRKGCGSRAVVNALISGYHTIEALAEKSGLKVASVHSLILRACPDEYGLDVMSFRGERGDTLYRVAGIMKWDGSYYDLMAKKYKNM